jgi:molecular chaperone DnaK (HSP70)
VSIFLAGCITTPVKESFDIDENILLMIDETDEAINDEPAEIVTASVGSPTLKGILKMVPNLDRLMSAPRVSAAPIVTWKEEVVVEETFDKKGTVVKRVTKTTKTKVDEPVEITPPKVEKAEEPPAIKPVEQTTSLVAVITGLLTATTALILAIRKFRETVVVEKSPSLIITT